jgi:protein required for attachment to host cells
MSKHPLVWVVLADGGHAKIVTRTEDGPGFRIVTEFDSPDAHHLSRDLGTDRPGRVRESANTAHHAVQPRHDPHASAQHAFVGTLADYLNKATMAGDCDELILFAPGHILHDLQASLHAAAQAKVKFHAPKDLTKLPFVELSSHIETLRQG